MVLINSWLLRHLWRFICNLQVQTTDFTAEQNEITIGPPSITHLKSWVGGDTQIKPTLISLEAIHVAYEKDIFASYQRNVITSFMFYCSLTQNIEYSDPTDTNQPLKKEITKLD